MAWSSTQFPPIVSQRQDPPIPCFSIKLHCCMNFSDPLDMIWVRLFVGHPTNWFPFNTTPKKCPKKRHTLGLDVFPVLGVPTFSSEAPDCPLRRLPDFPRSAGSPRRTRPKRRLPRRTKAAFGLGVRRKPLLWDGLAFDTSFFPLRESAVRCRRGKLRFDTAFKGNQVLDA